MQAASADAVVKTATHDANGFFVPARTTAVFRRASQTSCAPFSRDIFVRGVGADWAASPANQLQFLGGTIYEVTQDARGGPGSGRVQDRRRGLDERHGLRRREARSSSVSR